MVDRISGSSTTPAGTAGIAPQSSIEGSAGHVSGARGLPLGVRLAWWISLTKPMVCSMATNVALRSITPRA